MKLCPSKTCIMDACLTELLKRTLRIHVPYLMAMENNHNHAMLFVMLDLLAAFDTIDHAYLLTLLQDENGVHETALSRFRTYMEDHTYRAQIDSTTLEHITLQCGVPQRSVVGPVSFTLHTTPMQRLFRIHASYNPAVPYDQAERVRRLIDFIREVRQ